MKLEIRKGNIDLLETILPNVHMIEYCKNFTDDDNVFIKKFIDNRHNFPNLKSLDVGICGTNAYSIDLAKYEQLFFLFDDELIENIRISNGYDCIYKEKGEICARIPYSNAINLHPRINKIYFTQLGVHSGRISFRTIFNNFPTSLNKIIFVVSLSLIQETSIQILDETQKLPFGVELFLEINGHGRIKNIDFRLCDYVLNVKSGEKITFSDEARKQKNIILLNFS